MLDVSDSEIRLAAIGLDMIELPEAFAGRPDAIAVYLVLTGGTCAHLMIRPGLDSTRRAQVAEWAEQRIERFLEHGPEPDGWQRRGDGGWQLWGRVVPMPQEILNL